MICKKIIMVILFVIGFLELLVGIGLGFYPSLILGSCMLYGAVTLKNRIKKCENSETEEATTAIALCTEASVPKHHCLLIKDYLIATGMVLFSAVFIFTSLMTSTFPGIVVGVFFGFFGIKRISDKTKERNDYHADDSKTIH